MNGPLVIAYRQDGRDYECGGWTEQDVAEMLPEMKKAGCSGFRVYDGIAAAREKFPPDTRVLRAHGHPALRGRMGTATGEYEPRVPWVSVAVRWDGTAGAEWVLIDAGDIIVHLFKPAARAMYALEKMWGAELDEAGAAGTE